MARTKTEAQRAIIEIQTDSAAGQRPITQNLTVGQMVTEYMNAKKATWSDRTLWNNEALYARHIMPYMGYKIAAGIQAKDLRAYFETLTAGGLGDSGQRQIHVLLSGAYKRAIGDGLLRENPAQHARPVRAARAGPARVKSFTPQEAARFFEAALNDRWALPLAFLAVTGLRIGEALALTWDDFQEDPKMKDTYFVDISKTRSEFEGRHYEGAPKTSAGRRRVYLSKDAISIIGDMRRRVKIEAQAHGNGVSPYIFPSTDGRPSRQDTARSVMRRTCKAAGVPLLSPHALRHTFTSVMHSQGLNVADLSAHLGHAQISTTLNMYRTVFDIERRGVTLNLSAVKQEAQAAEVEVASLVKTDTRTGLPALKRSRKGGPRLS